MYAVGQGVPRDAVKAGQFYQKACDGGYAAGCYSLGSLYDEGRGVPQDAATAAQLYQKACAGGIAQACKSLKKP